MTAIIEKLRRMSVVIGECWIWSGSKSQGYGVVYVNNGRHRAHRLSYEAFKGQIPQGMCVLHSCDQPACVNPEHLSIGTQADNVLDMDRKGRRTVLIGPENPASKLSAEDVAEIRCHLPQSTLRGRPRKGSTETTISSIAMAYGVSRRTIRLIVQNRIWRHI